MQRAAEDNCYQLPMEEVPKLVAHAEHILVPRVSQGGGQHDEPWFGSTGGQEVPSSPHTFAHTLVHLATVGHNLQHRSVGWLQKAGECRCELCSHLCKISLREVDETGNRMQADISSSAKVSVCGFRSRAVFNYCKPFSS